MSRRGQYADDRPKSAHLGIFVFPLHCIFRKKYFAAAQDATICIAKLPIGEFRRTLCGVQASQEHLEAHRQADHS